MGFAVGEAVGPVVGSEDVGELVGVVVGFEVVGDTLGVVVGPTVGLIVGEMVGDVVGTDVVGDGVAHETVFAFSQYRSRRMLFSTGTTLLQLGWLPSKPLLACSTGSVRPHTKYSSVSPSGAPRSTLSR